MNVNPNFFLIPLILTCNFAFMFPVGTLNNAMGNLNKTSSIFLTNNLKLILKKVLKYGFIQVRDMVNFTLF